MKKNISNSRPFFQEAQILGSPDFAPKIYTQFQVKRNPYSLGHTYRKSSIKPPPPLQSALPYQGKKVNEPQLPLPLSLFTKKWCIVFIPLAGRSNLFLILSCMTYNHCTWAFPLCSSSSLWRTDAIVFAKLYKSPVSIKPPLKCVWNK